MELYQVDAFTQRAFGGNPAAVCLMHGPGENAWMQQVAAEMNLAETAFLWPQTDGYSLRWFTPTVEVDLCGHATLASAHILWETGRLSRSETARFWTHSGLLTALCDGDRIVLDFPAKAPIDADPAPGLLEALKVGPVYVGRNQFDFLVEVATAEEVRAARPDFVLLRGIPVRGVILTSRSDSPDFDFISRFFAPAAGIDEDPATGSSHCCLGPYWQARLGKSEFNAFQASPRGGELHVCVDGHRVLLGGHAVTVLRGDLVA